MTEEEREWFKLFKNCKTVKMRTGKRIHIIQRHAFNTVTNSAWTLCGQIILLDKEEHLIQVRPATSVDCKVCLKSLEIRMYNYRRRPNANPCFLREGEAV